MKQRLVPRPELPGRVGGRSAIFVVISSPLERTEMEAMGFQQLSFVGGCLGQKCGYAARSYSIFHSLLRHCHPWP